MLAQMQLCKQNRELLSAVIVTYKQEDYLYDTIDSVLQQDFPQIELIIADDGTPEFDVNKLREYIESKKKSNIVSVQILYDGKNYGTVRNINRAILCSNGSYIKLIGGDDAYSSSDVFSAQVEVLKNNEEVYAVVGKAQQCDCKMVPIHDERVESSNEAIPKVLGMGYDEARRYILKKDIFPIATQAICFSRLFFEKYGLFDERYLLVEDSPMVLRLLQYNKNVRYIDKYCVAHRSAVGISVSREMFASRRIKYYEDCVTYAELEYKKFPEVYGRINSIEIPRVNKMIRDIAIAKRDQKNILHQCFIFLKYCDAIIFYVLKNPQKLLRRVFGK